MKLINRIRERKLRKYCLKLAVKGRNINRDIISDAAVFEYYIKNGTDDISELVKFEDRVIRRY